MKEIFQMIVVLTLICTVCGLGLSGIKDMTEARIENQVLMNVQGPKVKKVLEGAENNLISDRQKISYADEEKLVFVGKKGGKDWAIAYETTGKGFGGDLVVMVGYNLKKDALTGIQIISHKETPGVGSRVAEDQFTNEFKGLQLDVRFPPEDCPEGIDAVAGATWSSRGVCEAVKKSIMIYPELKKLALATQQK
jgi:electron transport complex protein RnfG